MSRAVDTKTNPFSSDETLQTIYNDIVNALNTPTTSLLEIEFLGKSHPLPAGINILLDGNSIAVPKAKLVQAFIVARKIFTISSKDTEGKEDDIRDSTAVILLMDPEHLTAANARKRLLQVSRGNSMEMLAVAIKTELRFLDGYLTSRLHRHTKSPTLWAHRRWVLELAGTVRMEPQILNDLESIVFVAAERHPRNYYAWLHMRWLMQSYPPDQQIIVNITALVKNWCLRHPNDTSSFSFLYFCLSYVDYEEYRGEVCLEILKLAVMFRWTHESVWVFLRTLVASGQVSQDIKLEFFQALEDVVVASSPQSPMALFKARDWYVKYEQGLELEEV